jgi:hypothetical protein
MSDTNISMNVEQKDTFERLTQENSQESKETQQQEVRLVDVPVQSDNIALNLMAAFLNMANRRGAFTLEESGKINECVKHFTRESKEQDSQQ